MDFIGTCLNVISRLLAISRNFDTERDTDCYKQNKSCHVIVMWLLLTD